MLTLATLVIVAVTIVLGFGLGFVLGAGEPRRALQVLCALWSLVAVVALWQLARFCSNTNEWGGDITPQLEMYGLALFQLPLFGIAAGAGALTRAVGVRTMAGIGAAAIVLLIVVSLVSGAGDDSYPRRFSGSGSSFSGMDYGTDIHAAAAAAPFPVLWFGPTAEGESLNDVELTDPLGEFVTGAIVDYDEHGTVQIWEGLAPSSGANDAFLSGPSITVHGATFWFVQGAMLGKIRGRDVTIDAPVRTRAQWTRLLRSLRWVCPPAKPHCSGW